MPNEPNVYDLKEFDLKIVDGTTPTANEITVIFGDGNFTWKRIRNIEYRKNRGKLNRTREGDQEPMEVSFEGEISAVRSESGANVTVVEALEKIHEASTWVTTGGACEPYSVDLHLERQNDCTDVEDELKVFPEFRHENLDVDIASGQISVTGKCNAILPTVTREAIA